jgi:GNAT superfamily N-acetyltransferase
MRPRSARRSTGSIPAADGVPALTLRPYAERDFDALVPRWHATNRASYPYVALQQRHTLADARAFFRTVLLPRCRVVVAESGAALAGMIAVEAPWIRQLAVFAGYRRRGIATALLAQARAMSPHELRLYTFRQNAPARAFYAARGFVPVALGVSPAPEFAPDVEYHWRHDDSASAPMTPKRNSSCPLCGGPNDCAPARTGSFDEPCWCMSVAFDPEALARIPEATRNQACLCRRCATGTAAGT